MTDKPELVPSKDRVSDAMLATSLKRYGNNKAGDMYRLLFELQERRADKIPSEPLLTAAKAVLTHFAPTFPDSRAWDDCLVGLAVAVSNFEAKPHGHETGCCLWQREYPDNEFFFTTGCGQEGVNRETSYLFCPYCSKKLTTREPNELKACE